MAAEEKPCNSEPEETEEAQTENIEEFKKALADEKEKAQKYLANWQRAVADFSNYKKRVEREKKELAEFANSGLIVELLPVIDDLDRAFTSVPPEAKELTWVEGIELIYNKLRGILTARGVAEIECKGEPFDPSRHEAVQCMEGEEGLVLEETQKGYKFKDKVIRPSKVIVGQNKQASKEKED